MRGYFGICMYHPKTYENWGSLLRTANLLGANFIATIGQRFHKQSSDTLKTWRHVPVFQYDTFEDFYKNLPHDCRLVGVEMSDNAIELKDFNHHQRSVYILGAEDYGLPEKVMEKCHSVIKLQGERSMNVAVAGSIVLYHRVGM